MLLGELHEEAGSAGACGKADAALEEEHDGGQGRLELGGVHDLRRGDRGR